jgi:hypothetical protein
VSRLAKSSLATLAPTTDCPGSDRYKPEVRQLSNAELERRLQASRLVPPSAAQRQLESLKATASASDPSTRDCTYRMMLMGSVATEETTLDAEPRLWGHTREVKELELLFLEMPLLQRWNVAQRKDVLAQIDATFIAALTEEEPGDREHWRRQYYGIELTCEATDEVLEQLKAKRPKECLALTPR